MIIQCSSCSKKFQVKDSDIPKKGRLVQCSYCSQQWFQTPIKKKITTSSKTADNKKVSQMEFEASDGRVYKFMGKQWAEILRSGKTGLLAKKSIAEELYRRAEMPIPKKTQKKIKKNKIIEIDNTSKLIDPSSEQINESFDDKKGLGFLGYIILFIIVTLSIVGILKTFQNELIMYFPETKFIYDRGENIFESMGYIIIIIKDLIKSY